MATFLENLWGSIFQAGPTPTLLIATNVTFGALQFLLAVLLFATYSIHFAILSFLSAGLWYSINWFANELRAAQAKEEEAERLRKRKRDGDRRKTGDAADSADDEGDNTEVEGEKTGLSESASSLISGEEHEQIREDVQDALRAAEKSAATVSGAESGSSGQASGLGQRTRHRAPQRSGDLSGEISTDSEWEKVDGDR